MVLLNTVLFFVILLLSMFSISQSLASTEIANKYFKFGETLKLNGVNYSIMVGMSNKGVMLSSIFSDIVVIEDQCNKKDGYEFCLDQIKVSNMTILADPTTKVQVKLRVYQDEATEFSIANITKLKLTAGATCESDIDCISNRCFHGTCTYKTVVCGDGYCEENEPCKADCSNAINRITDTLISYPANLDWSKSIMKLMKDTEYNITVFYNYSIGGENKFNPSKSSPVINTSPCPEIKQGVIVANICGKCYFIEKYYNFTLDKTCDIMFRVNDQVLYNNLGYFEVEIEEVNRTEIIIEDNVTEEIVETDDGLKEKISIKEKPVIIDANNPIYIIIITFIIVLAVGVFIMFKLRKR